MQKQIKLYSILEHDTEFIKKKPRKKISKKEIKKRGNFIIPKEKDKVKKIINSIHNK